MTLLVASDGYLGGSPLSVANSGYIGGLASTGNTIYYGGGGGRTQNDENLIAQVLDKWSYIEAAQKRDAQKRQAAEAPIDAIEVQLPLEQSVVFKTPSIGIPYPIPAFDAAPVPRIGGALAPDMAERARRMRERDEEEALVMILLQALD